MQEKFLDMIKNKYTTHSLMSVYVNPTKSEMKSYIPTGARGYVDVKGNLYVEGYEEDYNTGLSDLIHDQLLKVLYESENITAQLKKTLAKLNKEGFHYDEMLEDCLLHGLCVVREGNTNYFTIAESYDWNFIMEEDDVAEDINILFGKAKGKNPDLKFGI
jgi:hypothetical protein